MAKDLMFVLEDRPGKLAEVGEAFGKAGVNLEGICGDARQGKGTLHILVEDAAGAKKVLKAAGIKVVEHEVVVLDIADKPGELGKVCRKLADAGVNINLTYLATTTRLVLGVDDLEKARAALK